MEKRQQEFPSVELLQQELMKERYKRSYRKAVKSTLYSLLVVAALAAIITMLFMPVLQISGTSMSTTLEDGDVVLAIKKRGYAEGDVVGFYYNNVILIKRVIASSGDWVDIDEKGNVFVNGTILEEPYVTEKALGDCNISLPYQVPDGKCFLMGDHRATSVDSRNTAVGCISQELIIGKLLLRVWPFSAIGAVR